MEALRKTYVRRAIQLAVENVSRGGGPFGAVIVCRGRIIAEGVNQVALLSDPTAHAEIAALREACRVEGRFHLTGYEIYSSCEPCPMCLAAIYWARLDRVFFAAARADAAEAGFSDARIYEELATPLTERRIPIEQLLQEEASCAFDAWRGKVGRIDY